MMLVSATLALAFSTRVLAASEPFVVSQVATFKNACSQVSVSGDRVAWTVLDDSYTNVGMMTWTPEGGVVQVVTGLSADYYPAISGDRIGWAETDPTSPGVFTWTPTLGTIKVSSDWTSAGPEVSGDRMAWNSWGHGNAVRVVTWTPAGGTVPLLADDRGADGAAQVSGNRIAWMSFDMSGVGEDTFTWTPAGGVVRLTNDGQCMGAPRVSGDRVAWSSYDATANRSSILTWTPTGGVVHVTDNGANDFGLALSGNRVAWIGPTDTGSDVFTWTPASGTFRVSTDGAQKRMVTVSGDRIVWDGQGGADGGTDFEVFTWAATEGVVQLTEDGQEDVLPRVSGDRIAWAKWGPGGGILTAVPSQSGPSIALLAPAAGPPSGGNNVVIHGTDFPADKSQVTVKFGTKTATIISITSSAEMTVKAPRGTTGSTVDVTVTKSGRTSANTPADDYSYGLPTVKKVDPNAGDAAGGDTVVISGSGFSGHVTVRFGSVPVAAADIRVDSPSRLTVVSPPAVLVGSVQVRVSNDYGASGATSAKVGSYLYKKDYRRGLLIDELERVRATFLDTQDLMVTGVAGMYTTKALITWSPFYLVNEWFMAITRGFRPALDILGNVASWVGSARSALATGGVGVSKFNDAAGKWKELARAKQLKAVHSLVFLEGLVGDLDSLDEYDLIPVHLTELSTTATQVAQQVGGNPFRISNYMNVAVANNAINPILLRNGDISGLRRLVLEGGRATTPNQARLKIKALFDDLILHVPATLPAGFPVAEVVNQLESLRSQLTTIGSRSVRYPSMLPNDPGWSFSETTLGLIDQGVQALPALVEAQFKKVMVQTKQMVDDLSPIMTAATLYSVGHGWTSVGGETYEIFLTAAEQAKIFAEGGVELLSYSQTPVQALEELQTVMTFELSNEIGRLWQMADGVERCVRFRLDQGI